MATPARSQIGRKTNDNMRLIFATFVGTVFGFFLGVSFPTLSLTTFNFPSTLLPAAELPDANSALSTHTISTPWKSVREKNTRLNRSTQIWVPTNPPGAEMLAPGIVAADSDLYLRRLWGLPSEDLTVKPNYLVAFTVGYDQRKNIDAYVKKFSENFTIVLFHYDGRVTEWDEFEWSKRAIHVSARKQTKWWYAKRFLSPDIIAPYEYVFIWDEDLGVENFNAEEYIKLVRKHGLEISQPGVESNKSITWRMTKRRTEGEVHKVTEEKSGRCVDPHLPPCAAYVKDEKPSFVEIMAPVFSRDAWRCVWHMIQNDLVHGWGLDFALQKCVEPAHEKIGVVDAQWIVHLGSPTLGNQGQSENKKTALKEVRERCKKEWTMFQSRIVIAERAYLNAAASSLPLSNSTSP